MDFETEQDDELEIKIEYHETHDPDPLSEKRCRVAENVPEFKNYNGSSSSDEATVPSINLNHIASKTQYGTWHTNQDCLGRYLCKFCELTYLSTQTLRHHVKTKHPTEANILKSTTVKNKRNSKLKCHICKKRFKLLTDLQNHVTAEHNQDSILMSCYFCNASFSNDNEMKNHLYWKHKKDAKTVKIKYCNICGYRTLKQSHFTQHLNTHFQNKTVTCKLCDYTTDRTGNLKIHERIHMDFKPYHCDFKDCNYKSAARTALKSHQLKHTSENMLYCDKCSYKTVYKQSLKNHCMSHNNNSVR